MSSPRTTPGTAPSAPSAPSKPAASSARSTPAPGTAPGQQRARGRRVPRTAAALSVLAATTLFATGAAPAPAARADLTCTSIGRTVQDGTTISGSGAITAPCSGGATLVVQRSRWYGWEDMATQNFTGQHAQTITYDCAHTGIHDFRVYINSQHADGSYEFHESNHINANCG
ncbi:hypothetical protein [Streptomyces sp. GS7]|uniref:hypothetical protein n=1 Tax=Streptomyces sp. GS7 TaxID=2692234 RepID=UPI001316010D|nr:hypothetical protein [Streptomyces sp. GS7]QHC22207.1 hypothetical protein GR130_12970 [Streptomyces sp. GS7]